MFSRLDKVFVALALGDFCWEEEDGSLSEGEGEGEESPPPPCRPDICIERKYLVAAWRSCSRSSAVCLLKKTTFCNIEMVKKIILIKQTLCGCLSPICTRN